MTFLKIKNKSINYVTKNDKYVNINNDYFKNYHCFQLCISEFDFKIRKRKIKIYIYTIFYTREYIIKIYV